MAYTRTFAQLSLAVQQLGEWERSEDVTPAILLQVINYALIETYDIQVQKWQDAYTVSADQPLSINVGQYLLPVIIGTFYKLRHIDFAADGVTFDCPMLPTTLDAAYRYARSSGSSRRAPRYRIMGQVLHLEPAPAVNGTAMRVYYIPLPTQVLHVDDDQDITFQVPTEERLLVHYAARQIKVREDLDTANIDGEIARLIGLLRTAADGRDADQPFYLDPRGPPREWSDLDEDIW